MKTYKQFKKQALQNSSIRVSYEALGSEFEVIALLIKARLQKNMTQRDLAEKMGTKQSSIARLESGTYNPTLSFLYKIADALDARIKVSMDKK